MNKLIDFVLPVFGKDPLYTFKNIEKIIRIASDEVGFIIVYKNSKELNYDEIRKLESENVKVIKAASNVFKTKKLSMGIEQSKAYWVVPLDSHHYINYNNFLLSLSKLRKYKNKNIDIIWMMFNAFDQDKNRFVNPWLMGSKKVSNAGTQVLKRENIDLELIDFDIVFYDDFLWGMLASYDRKVKTKNLSHRFYTRVRGSNISTTFGKSSYEDLKKKNLHLDKLLYSMINLFSISNKKKTNKAFAYSLFFLFRMKINNILESQGISYKDIFKYPDDVLIEVYKLIFPDSDVQQNIKSMVEILKYGRRFNFKTGYWGYWPNKLNKKMLKLLKVHYEK